MIKVYCRKCQKELKEPGALVISPPKVSTKFLDRVYKTHLCTHCYLDLMIWLSDEPVGKRAVEEEKEE